MSLRGTVDTFNPVRLIASAFQYVAIALVAFVGLFGGIIIVLTIPGVVIGILQAVVYAFAGKENLLWWGFDYLKIILGVLMQVLMWILLALSVIADIFIGGLQLIANIAGNFLFPATYNSWGTKISGWTNLNFSVTTFTNTLLPFFKELYSIDTLYFPTATVEIT